MTFNHGERHATDRASKDPRQAARARARAVGGDSPLRGDRGGVPAVKSKFSPVRSELNCAGQACAERMTCLRYRRHAAFVGQKWASFDLERVLKGGACPGFERV